MARLESAGNNDRSPALSPAIHGRGRWQPTRRASTLSRTDSVPHPRHQPAVDDRDFRVFRVYPAHQRGHHRPLYSVKIGTRVVVLPATAVAAPVDSPRGIAAVTPSGVTSASDKPRKRQKSGDITRKLRQVDVLVSQGESIADA